LVTKELSGPVNAVSPNPLRVSEFMETFAHILNCKPRMPMPAFLLRLMLGEMADVFILASRRIIPRKLLDTGYAFRFGELEAVLRHELGKLADNQRANIKK
jgi:NAD dependent epimerase/dehydratase family enzyme